MLFGRQMYRPFLLYHSDECVYTALQLPEAKLLVSFLVSFCSTDMDEFIRASFKAIATILCTI